MDFRSECRLIGAYFDPRSGVVLVTRLRLFVNGRLVAERCAAAVFRTGDAGLAEQMGALLRERWGADAAATGFNN